jgi:ABC-type branched-subunit amino acid transport system substrate-binding protein
VPVLPLLAIAALLVATAGCGARWSDEQQAAVLARAEGGGDAAAGPAGAARGANTGAGAATGSTVAGGAAAPAAGGADPAAAAAGGAADPAAAGAGALPCSAPSDAPGVTDTEINLGTISSLSGPVPGLGETALEAVRAYAAFRNANGGVCGRQLNVRSGDDGTDNGRHRALVQELDSQVLGLAGGLGGGDAGSADTVAQLGMPVVSTAISEQFQNAATVFDTNPPFADPNQTIGKFRWLYDQGVRTAAIVYLGVDQTRSEIQGKQKPQMLAAGIQIVHEQELPLSTLSYDSAARQVANSGADYLLFLADYTQSASMARAMTDTGYELQFAEYVTAYGPGFLELAGPAAEGAVSWIRNLPNEEAGGNEEQGNFLEWMAQVAPDAQPDTFAADAWVATKALVESIEALQGPITREALLAQLHTLTAYDAGGFFGSINLGGKLNLGCLIAMRVEGGSWRRVTPAQGFLC